jgi:hypothetical protein
MILCFWLITEQHQRLWLLPWDTDLRQFFSVCSIISYDLGLVPYCYNLLMITFFQLWHLDDSCLGMGRYTCICDRNSPWNKRYDWNSRDGCVPNLAISYFNSQNRTLVNLVSGTFLSNYDHLKVILSTNHCPSSLFCALQAVDLPSSVHCFNMGPKSSFISIHADGWSSYL